jgi:5'-methylthioadenosine phosphorylase
MVIRNLTKNAAMAKAIISRVIPQIPKEPGWPCHSALQNAIMTDRKCWPEKTIQDLKPILQKYL